MEVFEGEMYRINFRHIFNFGGRQINLRAVMAHPLLMLEADD